MQALSTYIADKYAPCPQCTLRYVARGEHPDCVSTPNESGFCTTCHHDTLDAKANARLWSEYRDHKATFVRYESLDDSPYKAFALSSRVSAMSRRISTW